MYQNVVIPKLYDVCVLDIFNEMILSNNKKSEKIIRYIYLYIYNIVRWIDRYRYRHIDEHM